MKDFAIVVDSACDLTEEYLTKYNIRLLQGHIHLPDKTEITAFQKWETVTREQFYADLKNDPEGFSTSPPNVSEFQAEFESHLAEGRDVLCITLSSGISGSYNFSLQARELALANYPDRTVRCVDSLRFGPAFGLMAVHASMLRSEGKSLFDVTDWLETNKNRYHQAGWLDDLSFVAKKGRLTHAKAFFGTLVGVKPIGEFDYNGLTTVIGKVKGAKTAYRVLLDYIESTAVDLENQIVFIAHTNRYANAVKYKELIEEHFHPRAVYINDVFPICGINVGPGLMAAYYMGAPISADLSEEKCLIEQAIEKEQGT